MILPQKKRRRARWIHVSEVSEEARFSGDDEVYRSSGDVAALCSASTPRLAQQVQDLESSFQIAESMRTSPDCKHEQYITYENPSNAEHTRRICGRPMCVAFDVSLL